MLEKIYRRECVSPEDSDQMLSLLLNQDTRTKIPGGLKESVQVANKTGEMIKPSTILELSMEPERIIFYA